MPYASLNARRKLKDARICRGELAEYCCGYAFANIRIVLMNIVHCTNKKSPGVAWAFLKKIVFWITW